MLELLPLALASAVFPTLLAAVVVILGLPSPRPILLVYLAGALLSSVVTGLFWVYLFSADWIIDASDKRVNAGADLVGAVIALGLLVLILTGRDHPLLGRRSGEQTSNPAEEESWSRRGLTSGSTALVFLVGMVLALPGPIYLLALKDIAAADQSSAADVIGVVGYTLIKFTLAEVPLVGYTLSPQRTRVAVGRLNELLHDRNAEIGAALCLAVATALLVHGIAALT